MEDLPRPLRKAMQALTRSYARRCQKAGFVLVEEGSAGVDEANCITAAELAEPADRMCQRYMQRAKAAVAAPPRKKQLQRYSPPPQSLAAVKARMSQLSPVDMSPRVSSPTLTTLQ
jgi:hypothetical protein